MAWGEQAFSDFLSSNSKTLVEDCECLGCSSADYTDKTRRKFTKLSTKTNKFHFKDCWQVRPLMWNTPADFKQEFEYVADLHKFCATTVC